MDRNKILSLKGVALNAVICETLEEILKYIQFNEINLESTNLDDEASVALFDMLEYYEAVTHLNISSNQNIGVRGWQACARMIKKTRYLEALNACNTTLDEISMPILGRALKVASHLQILKLENCNLNGCSLIILASALKVNTSLTELYLNENNLATGDAKQLGSMLKCNTTLQLLDISHNNIKDVGFNCIIDGIIDQCFGLSVLMVWNNNLSINIAFPVLRLLEKYTGLETLNVGQNNLGNEFIRVVKNALISNRNLLRFGLQSTSLTDEAAFLLADVLKRNTYIQRVDLRDNDIQFIGVTALLECLETNNYLRRLDLDKIPRQDSFDETTTEKYKMLVEEIRGRCAENEKNILERAVVSESDENEDSVRELNAKYRKLKLSFVDLRKISLTCESLPFRPPPETSNFLGEPKKNGRLRSPAPSPTPSPVSSPSPVRSRFQVSKVIENQYDASLCVPAIKNMFAGGGGRTSRFTVTVVEQPETKPLTDNNLGADGVKESIVVSKDCNSGDKCHVGKENKSEDQIKWKLKGGCGQQTPSEKKLPEANRRKDVVVDKTDSKNKVGDCGGGGGGFANPIAEKIRKLSWVSPILKAPSAAIESAKIPNNLEKLLNLFQNPFNVCSNATAAKSKVDYVIMKDEIDYGDRNDSGGGGGGGNGKANNNGTPIADKVSKSNENIVERFAAADKRGEDRKSNRVEAAAYSDDKDVVIDSTSFPATWPQKLSPNYLPSPSKSSPNILGATAFALLQGHVSSDLAK